MLFEGPYIQLQWVYRERMFCVIQCAKLEAESRFYHPFSPRLRGEREGEKWEAGKKEVRRKENNLPPSSACMRCISVYIRAYTPRSELSLLRSQLSSNARTMEMEGEGGFTIYSNLYMHLHEPFCARIEWMGNWDRKKRNRAEMYYENIKKKKIRKIPMDERIVKSLIYTQ